MEHHATGTLHHWCVLSPRKYGWIGGRDYSLIKNQIKFVIGSEQPCYRRDRTQPSADECESIVIPTGFCETCGISKAVTKIGHYDNSLYTSGVERIDGVVHLACLDKML